MAIELDIGPLTWVKGEIDQALERARENLAGFSDNPVDVSPLRFCQTHLHQVTGAIQMVGLEGAARVSDEIEKGVAALGRQEAEPSAANIEAIGQAIQALAKYLADLLDGEPDVPLKLFPVYKNLHQVRGATDFTESDLFFPDLSVRAPKDPEARPVPEAELPALAKEKRVRYQSGLLKFLRDSEDAAGMEVMRGALLALERAQALPAQRTFWWAAGGLVESLINKGLNSDLEAKRLLGKVDQQIRRLAEASPKVADRVLRDVLYRVACSKPVSERVKQVKHVFDLDDCLPKAAAPAGTDADAARFKPLLRELKEQLAAAKDAWLKFATGHKDSLKNLQAAMPDLAEKIQTLGSPPLRDLFRQMQIMVAAQTGQDGAGESVALEMATALLLAESALENFAQPGKELPNQLDIQIRRMQAALGGRQEEIDATEIPHLGDISRKAQEKILLAQVAQEIQVNLRRIEEVLDAFFRDASKRDGLPALDPILKQVSGALKILELERADKLLGICRAGIRDFGAPAYQPAAQELEAVAEGLSSLGFYIEALQLDRPDAERIVAQTLARLTGEAEEAVGTPDEAEAEPAEESVEAGLGAQKNLAQESFDAWQAQPQNAAARQKLEIALSGLAQDADLVADAGLKEQTATVQRLLEESQEAPDAGLAGAVSALAEARIPPVPRSKEAVRLLDASEEAVDAELLETYLEEAAEVLATVGENLQICQEDPADREALTTIRRGFHTLKGSGRMVGLTDLGEVAWAVEQVLNKWLQEEQAATSALFDFVAHAHSRFEYWIGQLRVAGSVGVDANALLALAEQVKRGRENADQLPVPAEAAPAAIEEIDLPPIEAPLEEETAAVEVSAPVVFGVAENTLPIEIEAPAEGAAPGQPTAPAAAKEIVVPEAVRKIVAPGQEAGLTPAPPPETEVTIGDVSLSSALLGIYLNEARQRLATLQTEITQLEDHPDHPVRHDFMRAAHTLCGISRTVGFSAPAELSFELEALLRQMLEHPQPVKGKQLGVMGDVIVALKKMVQSIEEKKPPKPAKQLIRSVQALLKKARAEAEKTTPQMSAPAEEPSMPEQTGLAARPVPAPTSRDDIDSEILPLFLEEAHDLIPLVGTQLRAWRDSPAGDQAPQNLQRALHTLKGSARMAGALQLGDLVHNMETRVIDALDSAYPTAAYFDELDAYFDRIGDGLEKLQPRPAAPAVDALAATEGPPPAAIQAPAAKSGEQQLRVRADVVDRLVNEAGEISIARSRIEGEMQGVKQSLLELTENVIRLRNQVREIEIQAEGRMQSQSNQGGTAEAFDPLEFDRFTRFQELTRFLAESVNDVATVQQNLLKSLGEVDAALLQQARLNRELQQELMHIRMVPLSSIAERLHRIVRQTARELDKNATLEIKGGQVELDRSVLEKMTAPFEHLLRNSLAHGVETATERLGAGKPEAGTIRIEARQVGNEIVLTLSDDGSGFDLAGIRRRAVELGKLGAECDDIAPARLIDMMFDPGFSTAREVTQIAGRGIGLDVVRSEITGLGGRIEAAPGVDGGANFTIYLPLTLAVAQAVLVRVGEKVYALPSAMIEQVQEFKAAALEGIYQKGEIEWLGNRYALFYLPRLLGDRKSSPEQHRYSVALLLRSGGQRIAVHVDEILGNREVVVKNIGPQLARIPGIAGATVLGNGQVALIINPVPLAQRYALRDAAADAAPKAATPADLGIAAAPLIMVVDDSLTVRKITSRLLLKEGYQVVTAKDGVDALQQLQESLPDVMLVDIEMPRMDGFELTKNVRGDALTAHIPIVMITSRTADKHRNYARELGVNAYLGKPFQEEELLGHIAGFVKR